MRIVQCKRCTALWVCNQLCCFTKNLSSGFHTSKLWMMPLFSTTWAIILLNGKPMMHRSLRQRRIWSNCAYKQPYQSIAKIGFRKTLVEELSQSLQVYTVALFFFFFFNNNYVEGVKLRLESFIKPNASTKRIEIKSYLSPKETIKDTFVISLILESSKMLGIMSTIGEPKCTEFDLFDKVIKIPK